jgi:hypothetical protein
MKIVKISNEFYNIIKFDKEALDKDTRPYLLLLKLKYNCKYIDFVIPFRSNLKPSVKKYKDQYFPLPPNKATKKGNIHAIHYLKMLPINKNYIERFFFSDDQEYFKFLLDYIHKNEKVIVQKAQTYLYNYESNKRYNYATDIDKILTVIEDQ